MVHGKRIGSPCAPRHEIRSQLSGNRHGRGGIGSGAGINASGRTRTRERAIGCAVGRTRQRYPVRRPSPDLPARQPAEIRGTRLCRLARGATRRRDSRFLALRSKSGRASPQPSKRSAVLGLNSDGRVFTAHRGQRQGQAGLHHPCSCPVRAQYPMRCHRSGEIADNRSLACKIVCLVAGERPEPPTVFRFEAPHSKSRLRKLRCRTKTF